MTLPAAIETPRLRLRPWQASDSEPFAALNADAQVMEFFPKLLSPAESDKIIAILQAHIDKHGYGFWAAELRATGEFVGFIGIQAPRVILPFSPCVEIGWRLARAHWGSGYATEGAEASLQLGFGELELAEIVAFTAFHNERSLNVMRKLGMSEDGQTFEHPNIPAAHPLRVHRLYRLRREAWARAVPTP
jgi:RimJ/RimL family protein N-acetyltransferase